MNEKLKVVAIIPARGGSKGIPRKNLRPLMGKPLIAHSIEAVLQSKKIDRVIVTTDDLEIATVAEKFGAEVFLRPALLSGDEVPLDPVIYDVVERLEEKGEIFDVFVTVQPTSPLLKTNTLDKVVETLIKTRCDTVLTVKDDRHLAWTKEANTYVPKYKERKNRQYLPPEYRETGAVLASRRQTITPVNRIGKNVELVEVDVEESIDIDSPMDWWVVEKLMARKKVVLRVDGYNEIGLGHIYRALTLAHYIMDHELIFVMDANHKLGIELIEKQNFKRCLFEGDPLRTISELKPDIVINDILDTSEQYVLALKEMGAKVYNFEDLGLGAEHADGVFNALYPGSVPLNHFYTGEKYYCARTEFLSICPKQISDKVENVLVTYGGTDPNDLTLKTLKAIAKSKYKFDIDVVIGPGYKKNDVLEEEIEKLKKYKKQITLKKHINNMADYMHKADIVFSSAGRTMYEIAIIGTPAVIICQNHREMTHLFGHNYNGFINLGIHSEVKDRVILKTLERLIEDVNLRKNMNKRMLQHDLKNGIKQVCSIIFS